MSIEAMKLALAALETCRIRSVSEWSVEDITPKNVTAAIAALHTAIQQATPSIPSDGPSTYAQRFTAAVAVICGVTPPAALVCDWINKEERHDDLQQWVGSYAPGWVQNIAVLDAAHQMADQPTEGGNHEPAQQPATPASVQADSSEHLRVVASLGDALRRLSFAAQTTGGTDGPDAELQYAIGQAEQALSLGGIGQAMSATGEPVYWEWRHLSTHPYTVDFGKWSEWKRVEARNPIFTAEDELRTLRRYIADGYKYELRALYIHPAPSVPATPNVDVRTILLAIVPGDGNGEEVYAESVDDVVAKMTELSEREESLRTQVDLLTAAVEARGREIAKLKATGEPVQADSSEQPATGEPVLTVEREPDYWSGGHFYEGTKPHINPMKVWSLPIGTKLYTTPQPAQAKKKGVRNAP